MKLTACLAYFMLSHHGRGLGRAGLVLLTVSAASASPLATPLHVEKPPPAAAVPIVLHNDNLYLEFDTNTLRPTFVGGGPHGPNLITPVDASWWSAKVVVPGIDGTLDLTDASCAFRTDRYIIEKIGTLALRYEGCRPKLLPTYSTTLTTSINLTLTVLLPPKAHVAELGLRFESADDIGLWEWSLGLVGAVLPEAARVLEPTGFGVEHSGSAISSFSLVYPQATYQFLAQYMPSRSSWPVGLYVACHDPTAASKFIDFELGTSTNGTRVSSLRFRALAENAGVPLRPAVNNCRYHKA